MTMLETGVTGAKKISWEHDNPRDLLLQLVKQYPNADEETLTRHMRDRVLDDQSYLMPIITYFVRNNMRSLTGERASGGAAYKPRAVEAQRTRIEQTKAVIKKRVLLDLMMPNGKLLRDCTGADCTKFGGWFTTIGEKVGPNKRVGEVLNETGVRKLFEKA